MRRRALKFLPLLLVLGLLAGACTADNGEEADDDTLGEEGDDAVVAEGDEEDVAQTDDGGGTLGQVQDRGELVCGVNDAVPGFGFQDADGEFSGFDVEFCRVIAAAVLGDSEAVEFVPLTAEARFTALQAGEIDVLVRNTTWTASRDATEGGAFAMTTFYDGQGMMVRADSEFEEIEDMQDTAICVLSGTTTELNLASRFAAGDINYEPVPFEDNDTLLEAFREERCDGWTSDKSQLAAIRSEWEEGPEDLVILEETFSKEPLGPATRDGDTDWFDAVNWAIISTVQAEEFGIASDNVEEMMDSEDPEVLRFLGQPGIGEEDEGVVFDPGLGLDPDFAVNVVTQVGNYGEIYERNVGPDTPLGLERGVNNLWTEGGLLYPPPYR